MVIYFKKQASFKSRAVRAIKARSVSQLVTVANELAKDYFAPYACIDSHGTNILCWTLAGAQAWIPYMADHAKIVDSYDYQTIVARVQN